jgi:rhodanese-related sulfurtransferase
MNNNRLRLPVLLSFICIFAIGGAQAGEEAESVVEKIDVAAAKDYVAGHGDAVILDVRTPVEYDMSHITGAMNVNVQDDDFASLVAGLDKDKTYLVHCTRNPDNGRSSRALETMQSLGFKNLYSLEGGYVAWKEAELPLTEAEN